MNEIKEIESKLYELSVLMIELLNNLKDNNIITQEEYNTHIKLKKEFIKSINSSKN